MEKRNLAHGQITGKPEQLILWGAKDLGRLWRSRWRGAAPPWRSPTAGGGARRRGDLVMSKRADAFALPTPALEAAEGEALTTRWNARSKRSAPRSRIATA
jgi:hypothetical protein